MPYLGTSCLGPLQLFFGGSDVYEEKPKQRMLQYARSKWGEEYIAFQLNEPGRGMRRFGAAASWHEVSRVVDCMSPQRRHLYELIRSSRPCKPYIDIDLGDARHTESECLAILNRIIPQLFLIVYGIRLDESSLAWTSSSRPSKPVSLHLTVTTTPQVVFETNLEGRDHSAYSFARALKLALYEDGAAWLAEAVDESVYSTDREMRTINSTKYGVPEYPLRGLGPHRDESDYFVTWLAGETVALRHPAVHRPRKRQEEEDSYSVPSSWGQGQGKGAFRSYMKPYSNEWLYGVLDSIDDSYWQDRSSWLRIAAAMKSLGMTYEDFDSLSLRHGGSSYGGTMELWNSLEARSHNSPSLTTLCYYARESNPTTYDIVTALPDSDPRGMLVNPHVRRVLPGWKTIRFVKKIGVDDIGETVIAFGIGCKTSACRPYLIINMLTGDVCLRCKTCQRDFGHLSGVYLPHLSVTQRRALYLSLAALE